VEERDRMRNKWIGTGAVMGAVVLVALIGVACGSKTTPTSAGVASSTTPAARGGYGDNPYGGGGGGGQSPSAGPAASATVKQGAGGQLVFSPTTLTVKKGDTIEIDDVASISHTFTIDGQGVDVVNEGGQKQTVAITLAPGTYTFICRFHVSSGMQGTLTVTG
jgi:plastocyanin